MELHEGQTVYVKRIGNEARRYRGTYTTEEKISKIGREYFTIEGWTRERFYIENGFHDGKGYVSNYRVYLSMQEIADEEELASKIKRIQGAFAYNSAAITLEAARLICDILDKVYARKKPSK